MFIYLGDAAQIIISSFFALRGVFINATDMISVKMGNKGIINFFFSCKIQSFLNISGYPLSRLFTCIW